MMTTNSEILLEGSYFYFQNNVNFCQENFKFVQLLDQPNYHIYAEILSRIETGEFLKILIRYEMNQQFVPVQVKIEKSIGNKYALETFKYDVHNQELHYIFQGLKGNHELKKPHSSKHYLTSPAVSTSAIFTLSRKFDATGRTPVSFVSSPNEWTYEAPPAEKIVFAEFKNRELADFKLNNTPLAASHLALFEHDTSHPGADQPVDLILSKHYSLPYQLVQGDLKIVIKNLKKNV